MLIKQKSPLLPRNLALVTFGELLIMFSTMVNLLYLLYSTAQRCGLLHNFKSYGISGQIFVLISSFLSNRWFQVVYWKIQFAARTIKCLHIWQGVWAWRNCADFSISLKGKYAIIEYDWKNLPLWEIKWRSQWLENC